MIHLLLIWSNAYDKKDWIINDLKSSFAILKEIEICWTKKDFLNNLFVFYSHSQCHLDEYQYFRILESKMEHCGTNKFYAVIFEDKSPKLEERETSSGSTIVNVNVFDKKELYRKITGGGHKIHTSNDAWETNKDLTVLFGKNTEDFLKWIGNNEVREYNENCIGVNGFNSIQQFFYLLNNTIKYCILRNHEILPNQYTVEGHGDIDLLVENKNYARYLTLAHPVYKDPLRVYHLIKIDNKEIPFDFRHVGDLYYDNAWEKDILENRRFLEKGMYVPNNEDQYYSLLYHAYIQKYAVADDYHEKLRLYAERISVEYDANQNCAIVQLISFLKKHHYAITRPSDLSVPLNIQNQRIKDFIDETGIYIKSLLPDTHDTHNTKSFVSNVYEKPNSFIKVGSPFLIKNEYEILSQLSGCEYFPTIIGYRKGKDEDAIELSRMNGVNVFAFFQERQHQKEGYIRSFIQKSLDIIKELYYKGIIHRDFNESNLLVEISGDVCLVSLIDFGWAINIRSKQKVFTPMELGKTRALCYVKDINDHNDFYSLGALLKYMWPAIPFVRKCSSILQSINEEDYFINGKIPNIILILEKLIQNGFSPTDKLLIRFYQHKKTHTILNKVIWFIKKLKNKLHR